MFKFLNFFNKKEEKKEEKKVEEFVPNPKDAIVVRSFLSHDYSDISSSVYCHFAYDPDHEINASVKISDCSKVITIHNSYNETKESFLQRVKVLRNCLSEYIELVEMLD
jgi:hypothetical protein